MYEYNLVMLHYPFLYNIEFSLSAILLVLTSVNVWEESVIFFSPTDCRSSLILSVEVILDPSNELKSIPSLLSFWKSLYEMLK